MIAGKLLDSNVNSKGSWNGVSIWVDSARGSHGVGDVRFRRVVVWLMPVRYLLSRLTNSQQRGVSHSRIGSH